MIPNRNAAHALTRINGMGAGYVLDRINEAIKKGKFELQVLVEYPISQSLLVQLEELGYKCMLTGHDLKPTYHAPLYVTNFDKVTLLIDWGY